MLQECHFCQTVVKGEGWRGGGKYVSGVFGTVGVLTGLTGWTGFRTKDFTTESTENTEGDSRGGVGGNRGALFTPTRRGFSPADREAGEEWLRVSKIVNRVFGRLQ